MNSQLPRPSRLFSTISVLVIAGNLFLLSVFIAANVVEPNPFAMMLGGCSFLPMWVVIAIQQYRGTFRCVASAATTTSVLLYMIGGFMVFVLISMIAESVQDGVALRLIATPLIWMFVVAAGSLAFARMNALWSRQLRSALAAGAVAANRRGFSLRELLLAVSVIAAMTGITSQFIRSGPPRYAEHIEGSAAPFRLPPGATDVSYGKGYRGTIAYEFTTDELAFRRWVDSGIGSIEAQSAEVPVREITHPFTITRYYTHSSELTGPFDITVHIGLYYSWSKEDRGVYAAYDRSTGRAYYYAHYH